MIKWLIAGLGNPGAKYQNTRHNVGWQAIDFLEKFGDSASKLRDDCLLIKNETFMNDSGQSIAQTAHFYKIPTDHIIIIHDDVDMKFASTKKTFDSRSGGHRGVQSVIDHLSTQQFYRIKIGIWNLPVKKTKSITEHYVMESFSKEEREILEKNIFPTVKVLIEKTVT